MILFMLLRRLTPQTQIVKIGSMITAARLVLVAVAAALAVRPALSAGGALTVDGAVITE